MSTRSIFWMILLAGIMALVPLLGGCGLSPKAHDYPAWMVGNRSGCKIHCE